ncbi:hypothetical protein IY145_23410 [Methylosinus sp. H3A]|uniref:hypothetical protein n=1 Tax=Methylosinus sp. H3A TaxID=2785786 RepID=UPI0018C1FA67|nr:hypothetical protein [Methylosinus sp. H3A]MBG0812297.1 hypothetical protein [Methylosinus sp. H3A]
MGSSKANTHREALLAELLGDVGTLLDRADDLKKTLPAVEEAARVLGKATDDLPKAVGEFPERVREAARDAMGPVTAAAILAAKVKIDKEIEKTVEETKGEVRRAAAAALQNASDHSVSRARILTAGAIALAALVAGGMGYAFGRIERDEMKGGVQALAMRADAEEWLRLARANTDLKVTLQENCSGKNDFVSQGKRACSVPLWLEPAGPASNGAPEAASIATVLMTSGPAVWGFLGLICGILARKLILELARLRSARWLMDL